ncbi:eCIS core domain-containing protein [Streptomyces mayonensis]|uniref:eCIS core domain-containing protein n=1 Tax=Streptomyces mayonensis TaxID=2750816 RepID=UPI0027E49A8B|nr:DUF4157 domain-containing protein [Streptomyces sp. A108]
MSKGTTVHAHEEAGDQKAAKSGRVPHRAVSGPAAATAGRAAGASGAPMTPAAVLALQSSAGNNAVQRLINQDEHQHGAGCGHDGFDDKSPEGQSQLLAAAKETPSSPLPGAFLSRATSFFQNPNIAAGRVHSDPVAQRATAAMGAEAMTVGMDVFLGPNAIGNEEILAHEASHLDKNSRGIQETGSHSGAGGPAVTDPGQNSEVAAVNDGAAFKSGADVAPSVVAQRSVADHADEAE